MAVHNETLGAAIAICGVGGGGGGSSAVTGVKGASESRYRTGDVNISKVHIGLAEVDNTSDANKPVSTAQQAALDGKQDILTFDALPTEGSENPVTSGGVYSAITGNFDDLLPSMLNADNYVSLMKLWFKQNGAAAMTDYSSLCDRWYMITRTGWTGGTRFYHASASMVSEGTKVGDNVDMVAVPSTNEVAGQDDYQDVPLFHCLDCNWVLDGDGRPHITAIDGVCGNFERYDPEKLVGVIQMTGWCKYVDDAENGTYTYMYTDDTSTEGYAPLPEAVNLDGTVRSWVVHGKYLSGDDYGCYSGARPWSYNASHNTALANYHTKWGSHYGGKTSADDAFLKLMFFLKYGNLSTDDVLQGCLAYNYQYPVAVEETGVERVILTASQANNIKIGSTVMVGNPTAFSSGTTMNIDRGQAGMRAKVDRKKVTRKETLSSGNVAVYIDNGGVSFNTTSGTLQGNKTVGPVGVAAISDAVGGNVSSFTVNIGPAQSGSGDPSPDNVRPVSGWTGAKVTRTGRNLAASIYNSNATVIYSAALYIEAELMPSTTYTISFSGTEGNKLYINEAVFTNYVRFTISGDRTTVTVTTASTLSRTDAREYIDGQGWLIFKNAESQSNANTFEDVQIELGSAASAYEPYVETTYDVTFPSEAGTVYGGTLDVVNGVLTVDMGYVTETDFEYAGNNYRGIPYFNVPRSYPLAVDSGSGMSSMLLLKNGNEGWASGTECYSVGAGGFPVRVYTNLATNTDEFIAQYAGLQICYQLATPVTYQLTPQEIALLTGNNTISADCGNVTVQYNANVPAPTYISTSPWFTGICDNVKGRDGSPSDPSNGSEPYILQGIECAMGGYEVISDTIIKYYKDASGKYHMTYYICRDAGKYSTDITADYGLVDYEVDCPASNSWQYISEHNRDDNFPEACFPYLIGCTSSQRTKDGMYILAASESVYAYWSIGNLATGNGGGGLSNIRTANGLGFCDWYFLARLSATGNRGVYNGGE